MSFEDKLYPILSLYYDLPSFLVRPAGEIYRRLPDTVKYGRTYKRFRELIAKHDQGDLDLVNEFFVSSFRSALSTKFYPEFYANHGVDVSQIQDISDIQRLPIINKSILKEHFSDLTVPDKSKDGLYLTTGGSTGKPVGFFLEKSVSRSKEAAFINFAWESLGFRKGDRSLILRGIRFSGNLVRYDPIKNSLLVSSYDLTEENIGKIVKKINKFSPKFIHAYPSSIYLLCRLMKNVGLYFDFNVHGIMCTSENLYHEHVKFVEDFLNTKVLGVYGHAERLVMAFQDRSDRHYRFNTIYGHASLNDAKGDLCGDGESGSIIATGFHNSVMPLIRYDTEDFAFQSSYRNFRLELSSIEGRKHEFVFSNEFRPVSMTSINMHSDIFDSIERFQFSQEVPGEVVFIYQASSPLSSEELSRIESALLKKLGKGFELKFRITDEIPLTKSGKQTFLANGLDI